MLIQGNQELTQPAEKNITKNTRSSRKRFWNFPRIVRWLTSLLAIFFIIIAVQYKIEGKEISLFSELVTKKIEPLSVILALLGIAISWEIFLSVKKETDEKDEVFNKKINTINKSVDKLEDATQAIDNSLNKILESYTSLQEIKGFKDRLDVISDIFKLSETEGNSLYIMTHSVNYGNILAHQVKTLCEDRASIFEVNDFTEFFKKVLDPNLKRIDSFLERIENLVERVPVKLLFLDGKKYERMLFKVAKNHEIKLFDNLTKEKFDYNDYSDSYIRKVDDLHDFSKANSEKKYFIGELLKYNEHSFKRLENRIKKYSHGLSDASRVSYLPFQFIASIPNDRKFGKRKCLVVFTNMYGDESKIVDTLTCFASENDNLIENLINIFEKTHDADTGLKKSSQSFRNFFGFDDPQEIGIIMHEEKFKGSLKNDVECSVRYDDDVVAEQAMRQLFIRFDSPIKTDFISDNLYETKIENLSSLLTIGLFKNKFSEMLLDSPTVKSILTVTNESESKIICVRPGTPTEKKYTSNFKANILGTYDYAIFAKLRYQGRTVILCGGCESIGTRKVGQLIFNAESWEEMFTKQGAKFNIPNIYKSDESFVCIYSVGVANDDMESPIELEDYFVLSKNSL